MKAMNLSLIGFLLVACGKPSGAVNLNVVNAGSAVADPPAARLARATAFLEEAPTQQTQVGAASAAQLKSLKYYITEIKLCQTLETKGTGFMAGSDCSTVYRSFDDIRNYDGYGVEQAKADTNENHYIDVMDLEAARRKLNQKAPIEAAEYNYGVITWMKPVKVKAEVTLGDGTTLVTPAKLTQVADEGFYHMEADSLVGHPGEVEESVAILNNGGTYFKFQKPLVVKPNEEATLDLVFNPDSIVKGSSAASNYAIQEAPSAGDNLRAISVPMLQMSPVVRAASETTLKESYLIAGPTSDIRVELYVVKEDASRSIRGIDLRTIYNEKTTSNIMDPGMVTSMSANEDGSLDLIDWQGGKMIASFKRLEAAGETGSARIGCDSASISGAQICGSITGDLDSSYRLVEISEVK